MKSSNSSCIQVFSKAAIEGYCKTRLIPEIGNALTLSLHKQMLNKTVETCSKISQVDIQLWCTPTTDHPYFRYLYRNYSLQLHQQQGSNLGEIMNHASHQAFTDAGYDNVVQIGTDCPYMTSEYIERAIDALGDEDACVIGPATDGGYVLFAMNRERPEILDKIQWGTRYVLQKLEDNLQLYNVKYSCLEALNDIDTYSDYEEWMLSQRQIFRHY